MLYENSPDKPLSSKVLQDTIFAAAYNAFDNASNPNRTRGGLKKCDDMYVDQALLHLPSHTHTTTE